MPIYLGKDKISSGGGGVSIEEITPEAIGALPETTTPADIGAEERKLLFSNVQIASTSFVEDVTFEDFPYLAVIPLSGVTMDMVPEVIFDITEATSGIFAPVTETYEGGIYLYANSVPETDIIIPIIICWKANNTELVTPFATLTVRYPAGSICTCTDSIKIFTAENENGIWTFNIPYAATWNISCTNGIKTSNDTVKITTRGQRENISMDYRDYVIRNGSLVGDFNISTTTATYEQNGDCLVFKSTVASSGNGSITINENGQNIDFSNRSILNFDTEAISPREGTLDYVKWGATGATSVQKSLGVDTPVERQIVSVDISNTSSGTISLFISDNPATVELKIYNAWFEEEEV